MSGFKRLKKSDIIVTPYVANKQWGFFYSSYANANDGIRIYKGTRLTGSFNINTDPITEGQYERLVYNSINNIFYPQAYTESISGSIPNYYTGSLGHNQTSPYYYEYTTNPNFISNFPTSSGAGIRVLSISKNLYGQAVQPGTFLLSSSAYYIQDDTNGNIYDYLASSSGYFIGNIFYQQGLAVITDQGYQNMFPLPPLAINDNYVFSSSQSPKTFNVSSNDIARNGHIDSSSIQFIAGNSSSFILNGDGTATLNTTTPGSYQVTYTVNEIFGNTTLTSNPAVITVTVVSDSNNINNNSFYTNPVVLDGNSIVGNRASGSWFIPANTIIFPTYFSSATGSLTLRIRLTDSTGVTDDYVSPSKTILSYNLDYFKLDFSSVNYYMFDTYYVEYLQKDGNWGLISPGYQPTGLLSAGFFGNIAGVNTPPSLTASFVPKYLTSYITNESASNSWKIGDFASGSLLTVSQSGQYNPISTSVSVSVHTINVDSQNVVGTNIYFNSFTSSYVNNYYYTNDFHIINSSASLNLDFGNVLQTIYGTGSTSLGRLFYTYTPPPISHSYIWQANTFTCEQDSVFTQVNQVTGLSSPSLLAYDQTNAVVYVVDADDATDNFYKFNPNGFSSSAQITHISGCQDLIYITAVDSQYRRLYAAGKNTGGLKVLNFATETVTTVPYGYDDNTHPGNGFNRLGLSLFTSTILAYDDYSKTLTAIDRSSLGIDFTISSSAMSSGSAFIGGGSTYTQVNNEIWVMPHELGVTPNIGRYPNNLVGFNGQIDFKSPGLPYASKTWDNSAYWRSGYYDSVYSKFYLMDWGSSILSVIDTNTLSVIYYHQFLNRERKSNIVLFPVIDPISNDLFFSGMFANTTNDSGIKVTYLVSRTTYQVTQIYPLTSFGNLIQIGSTNTMYGSTAGVLYWNSPNTGWNTDGLITQFTR